MSDPSDLRDLRARLLRWFDRSHRALPWRATRDPYSILVSEVMLQQTRVETVIPYYHRFLRRFPDARALAAGSEDEVLALWAGLGYYRRARLLKRTAEAVARDHGGEFPRDAAALRELPGIGRYTAGAVASIAFDREEPLVDGNVARVLARLYRIAGDARERAVAQRLWDAAGALVRGARPGDFNQALMELGAVVCTARAPRCPECPIARGCEARLAGDVEKFPSARPRPAPVDVRIASCIVARGSSIALVRRAAGTRMAGLLDLPAVEVAPGEDAAAAVRAHLEESVGLAVAGVAALGVVRHTITHHRIRIEVHRARLLRRVDRDAVRERSAAVPSGAAARTTRRIAAEADAAGALLVERADLPAAGLAAPARKALALEAAYAREQRAPRAGQRP